MNTGSPQKRVLVLAAAAVIGTSAFFAAPSVGKWSREAAYKRRLGVSGVVSAFASSSHREFAGRLTPGFAYRPLHRATRRPAVRSAVDVKLRIYASAGGLFTERASPADARTLHGRGITHLVMGEAEAAISSLEAAVRRETGQSSTRAALAQSNNAALLSDLAAASYELGRTEGRTEWVLRAIEIASRATSLDPALAPASFNLALAIEAVHAPSQAIAAWNRYLDLDPGSEWSAEARDRVRALTEHVSRIRDRDPAPEDIAERIETVLLGGVGRGLPDWQSPRCGEGVTGSGDARATSAQLLRERPVPSSDPSHPSGGAERS